MSDAPPSVSAAPRVITRKPFAAAALLAVVLAIGCQQTPQLAMEHLRRGDIALAEGRYAEALSAYSHARELSPTDPSVQRAMMQARVHLIAESAARVTPEAMEDARYEAGLLLDTDKPRAHVYLTALANVLIRQGDAEGAKVKLAEALKANPNSWMAHTSLGLLFIARKEDAPKAKAELELALKAKPDAIFALVAMGQIKLAEGDLPGAVDRLETALRYGDDFDLRMSLGRARMQQQKPGDAVPHFERASRLDPKSPDALFGLGQALLTVGKPEDAERALRAALQMRPDIEGRSALGFALLRQRKLSPALALFGDILAQDPGAPTALYGAGTASEELGRKEQALDYYQRLAALPSGSHDRQMLSDLKRDAEARIAVLSAEANAPKKSN